MNFFKKSDQNVSNILKNTFLGGLRPPPDPPTMHLLFFIKITNSIVRAEFLFVVRKLMPSFCFPDSARKMSMKSQEVKLIYEKNVSFWKKTWLWIQFSPKSEIVRPPPRGSCFLVKKNRLYGHLRPSFLVGIFLIR